jgi:hypothetical protein
MEMEVEADARDDDGGTEIRSIEVNWREKNRSM